jgi:outer membrane protein assembly factor BamE (lipoprotein component of BamABCDE complex)
MIIRKFSIAMVSLLLASCALFSKAKQENVSKIQIGQTKNEVLEILGEPESQSVSGREEKWHYEIITSDERRTDPYTAIFEDGTLKQWYFDTARNTPEPAARGNKRSSKHDVPGE